MPSVSKAAKELTISRKKLQKISGDTAASAEAADLAYVSDTQPGITRVRSGSGFAYKKAGQAVKDEKILARIKSLVIPPAWEKVWISASENGHLQATGIDVRGRKQYRYHPKWTAVRGHAKFFHLYEFGQALPAVRKKLAEDLDDRTLTKRKVLAAAVSIMGMTGIRVGNSEYEKLYGSFGLSTLKDKHVRITGGSVQFQFKGKKGVYQDVSLASKKLARIVKQCRDLPGKELFQYVEDSGERCTITSGEVNNYIKEISGGHFTAKDFRTWAGSLHCLTTFRGIKEVEGAPAADLKKHVNDALDAVSAHLGNTRTVCRKYYVHPAIIDLFEGGKLKPLLQTKSPESGAAYSGLAPEEKMLMRVLEAQKSAVTV